MISEASILTTSLYDIHIRRWLKHFDRGNMLVMDGRSLQTQPIVAIRRAQNFLRISDSIPSKAFKGVAQPYLFLWEFFRELQLWDRSQTLHGCRADLVGELAFFKFWKIIFNSRVISGLLPKLAKKDGVN